MIHEDSEVTRGQSSGTTGYNISADKEIPEQSATSSPEVADIILTGIVDVSEGKETIIAKDKSPHGLEEREFASTGGNVVGTTVET